MKGDRKREIEGGRGIWAFLRITDACYGARYVNGKKRGTRNLKKRDCVRKSWQNAARTCM